MAGTDVYYNGCLMRNVQTRQWQQEVAYDESGTDVVSCHYRLSFEGIIHGQRDGLSVVGGPPFVNHTNGFPGADPVSTYQVLHHQLSQARRELRVLMNNQVVLEIDEKIDTDNGPKPRVISLTHIAGATAFRVQFEIEVSTVPCLGKKPALVLNNRWSVSEEMDDNYYVTRVIRGHIRLPNSKIPAHAYKGVVIPSGELGFKRQRIWYEVAPNGLDANYEVIDRQQYMAAPYPATSWEVRHTDVTSANASVYSAELSVRLTAPPNADRVMLINLVFAVAEARIRLQERKRQGTGFIELSALTEYFGAENAVEGMFRVAYQGLSPGEYTSGLKVEAGNFPQRMRAAAGGEYDAKKPQLPATYGYNTLGGNDSKRDPAVLFLLHCYVQEPCSGPHGIAGVGPGKKTEKTEVVDTKGVQVSGTRTTTIRPSPGDYFSRATKIAPYTYCRMSSTYGLGNSRVQLPDAGWNGETGADTCHVARLGGPMAYRIIKADCERAGLPPELPVPVDTYTDSGLRGTLMDFWVEVLPATTSAGGQSPIHRVIAYYRYALNRPPSLSHKIRVGVLPFTTFSPDWDPSQVFRGKV